MSKSMLNKLAAILDKKQKRQIILLVIVILIGGILETVGVSLIVPVASAVLDEEAFGRNKYVQMFSNLLHIESTRQFIYLLILALIAMFILKNLYLLFSIYLQARFVNSNRYRCTSNLLSLYLGRPYEYYLYADTASILRTIYGDMDNVFNLLMQCLNLLAEVVVAGCLGLFLLVMDPGMMVTIVGLMLIVTILVSKLVKPYLNKIGEESRKTQGNLYKWILQSVTGIKDVKVSHKENYFTGQYAVNSKKYSEYQVKNSVLTNVPKLLLETVAIVGILGYLGVSMMLGSDLSNMLTLISAFGLAAVRLLPSVNRINTYMANIAYYEPALDYIYENVDVETLRQMTDVKFNAASETSKKIEKKPEITLKKKILLSNITFAYPNTDKYIFRDADMEIPVGKSIGVVGASGAGKTTVVDILLGLLKIQGGKILSDGVDIFENYGGWLSHIGYIPQSIYMLDDSIRNNIAFGVKEEEISDARVWEVLEKAQLKKFVEELPEGLDAQIGERGVRISGGQRQRLGIARALYHDPELLIFDEATSALDNDTETAIMEAVDSLHGEKTMVIIAHRLRTIENCDMIYEVKDQKMVLTESK